MDRKTEVWVYSIYDDATSPSAWRRREDLAAEYAEDDFDEFIYYIKEI